MFVIISYDIVDNRRRLKVSNELENYGFRVQYSVFEATIDCRKLDDLINKIEPLIKKDEDSIRIYRLCDTCLEKIKIFGVGEVVRDKDFYII